MNSLSAVAANTPAQGKTRKKKGPSKPLTAEEMVQRIIDLGVTTLEVMPLLSDGEDINAAIMLDRFVEEIASVTGKRLVHSCPLTDGTEAYCSYASKVVAEMEQMSQASEMCMQIIDASVDHKNYVYGLTASRELFEVINHSSSLLCRLAPHRNDAGPGDKVPPYCSTNLPEKSE